MKNAALYNISKEREGLNMIDFKNAEYLKLMEMDPRKGTQQVESMLIPGEQEIGRAHV